MTQEEKPKTQHLPDTPERIRILAVGAVFGVLSVLLIMEVLRFAILSLFGFHTGTYFQLGFLPRFYPLFSSETNIYLLLPMLALPFIIMVIFIEFIDLFLRRIKSFTRRIFLFSFEFIHVTFFLFSGFFLLFRIAVKKNLPPDWNYLFTLYPPKTMEENLLRVLAGAVIIFLYSGFALSRTKNSLTQGEEKFSLPSGKPKS